jgi:hypothetical protein
MTPSAAKENRERAEIMKAEARMREQEPTTMHGFAMAEMAQSRGRFAEAEGKQHVVGSTPGPAYPRLPSGPWSGRDPVPDEPPLGSDINFVEPCGTAAEIEASLRALASPTGVASPVVTGPTSDAPSPLMVDGDVPRSDVGPSSSEEQTND